MASRKKQPEQELLPPEDDGLRIETKPTKKVVVSRVETFDAPAEVTLKENDDEFEYEGESRKRNKPTPKEQASKLRDRWASKGIAPTGNLQISIFKFINEDDPMSGAQAEKAYCMKFRTTEEAIDSGVHLEAAGKFGPGRYWLMIYLNNRIVDQWEFRVAGSQFGQVAQNGQTVLMSDPQNPGVTIQMPANQMQADPFADFDKTLKYMERMEKMRQTLGLTPNQQQTPQKSENEMLLSALANNPKLVENAVDGIFKFGRRGGGDDDVSWAGVVKELITSEQGPAVVREFVGGIFNGFKGMFEGNQNEQRQMASQNVQTHPVQMERQFMRPNTAIQGDEAGASADWQGNGNGLQANQFSENQTQQAAPEDELFSRVLNFCKRKTPPDKAAEKITIFANAVEANPAGMSPDGRLVREFPVGSSIWPDIETFVNTPADAVLLYVASLEGGKEITELEWAKAWCEQLQAELKPAVEQGGEQE